MYERILVPLDGSNAAEIVLPYAEEIAARTGAEIILLSVSDPTTTGMDHLYRAYIERIEGLTGVKAGLISTGPRRDQTILRSTPALRQWGLTR